MLCNEMTASLTSNGSYAIVIRHELHYAAERVRLDLALFVNASAQIPWFTSGNFCHVRMYSVQLGYVLLKSHSSCFSISGKCTIKQASLLYGVQTHLPLKLKCLCNKFETPF